MISSVFFFRGTSPSSEIFATTQTLLKLLICSAVNSECFTEQYYVIAYTDCHFLYHALIAEKYTKKKKQTSVKSTCFNFRI